MKVLDEVRVRLARALCESEEQELRDACYAFAGTTEPAELIGKCERVKYNYLPYEDFHVNGQLAVRLWPCEFEIGRSYSFSRNIQRFWQAKLKEDTGGGCSLCGSVPCHNVEGAYWLCEDCKEECFY